MRPFGLALALTLGAPIASAQPHNPRLTARLVALAPGASTWSAAPVQARVGEEVRLSVVLDFGRGRLLGDVSPVALDGRARVVTGALPAGARVTWAQVEPRREHVTTPSPNPGVTSFSNAVLFGPRHGRWLGYDTLEYTQRTLPGEGVTRALRAARPGDAAEDTHGGAGSTWLAAAVTLPDGTEVHTPDATSVDRLGLTREVMRVSFRADDSYGAWLSTYFHVTSVFGSNGPTAALHQADRYTGADCADVLVGALRASGRRELAYTSVAGIGAYARALTGPLRIDGGGLRDASGATVRLRWGTEVAAGDLVTIDYADDPDASLPRAWDHIGALVRDDGDGALSPNDTLRHMGGRGLEDSALVHGGPMRVVVWRWRARARR